MSSTVTQCWQETLACQTVVSSHEGLSDSLTYLEKQWSSSFTDRVSALVVASRSNLLRFLVLPLRRPVNSKTMSPLLA